MRYDRITAVRSAQSLGTVRVLKNIHLRIILHHYFFLLLPLELHTRRSLATSSREFGLLLCAVHWLRVAQSILVVKLNGDLMIVRSSVQASTLDTGHVRHDLELGVQRAPAVRAKLFAQSVILTMLPFSSHSITQCLLIFPLAPFAS